MWAVRRLVRKHALALAVLYALALTLRIAVPGGFMPTTLDGRMVVSICSGTETKTVVIEIPGLKERSEKPGHSDQIGHDKPCTYAGLTMSVIGTTASCLLPDALYFAAREGLRSTPLSVALARSGLPPWVRGPPVPA